MVQPEWARCVPLFVCSVPSIAFVILVPSFILSFLPSLLHTFFISFYSFFLSVLPSLVLSLFLYFLPTQLSSVFLWLVIGCDPVEYSRIGVHVKETACISGSHSTIRGSTTTVKKASSVAWESRHAHMLSRSTVELFLVRHSTGLLLAHQLNRASHWDATKTNRQLHSPRAVWRTHAGIQCKANTFAVFLWVTFQSIECDTSAFSAVWNSLLLNCFTSVKQFNCIVSVYVTQKVIVLFCSSQYSKILHSGLFSSLTYGTGN
jgi:hypothetical protein